MHAIPLILQFDEIIDSEKKQHGEVVAVQKITVNDYHVSILTHCLIIIIEQQQSQP